MTANDQGNTMWPRSNNCIVKHNECPVQMVQRDLTRHNRSQIRTSQSTKAHEPRICNQSCTRIFTICLGLKSRFDRFLKQPTRYWSINRWMWTESFFISLTSLKNQSPSCNSIFWPQFSVHQKTIRDQVGSMINYTNTIKRIISSFVMASASTGKNQSHVRQLHSLISNKGLVTSLPMIIIEEIVPFSFAVVLD